MLLHTLNLQVTFSHQQKTLPTLKTIRTIRLLRENSHFEAKKAHFSIHNKIIFGKKHPEVNNSVKILSHGVANRSSLKVNDGLLGLAIFFLSSTTTRPHRNGPADDTHHGARTENRRLTRLDKINGETLARSRSFSGWEDTAIRSFTFFLTTGCPPSSRRKRNAFVRRENQTNWPSKRVKSLAGNTTFPLVTVDHPSLAPFCTNLQILKNRSLSDFMLAEKTPARMCVSILSLAALLTFLSLER